MTTGKVKWFNNAKGYGFILSEESGDDIFAHYSAIEMDGYKTLKAGQVVNFELIDGDKGAHAAHIHGDDDAPTQSQPSNGAAAQTGTQPSNDSENYNY